jgi:putative SOS response-associated peptidase YedK
VSLTPRWNVAPRQRMPVIVRNGTEFQIVEMDWGFHSVRPAPIINSKSETVKHVFSNYIENRCLVPADGFYEWTADKSPVKFTKPQDEGFCLAGLWQHIRIGNKVVNNFLILTTSPNETVSKVHNRMPFIVQEEHHGWWLNAGSELFESVLNNPDKEELNWLPVQRELNKVTSEGPELILPAVNNQKELF